MKCSTIAAAGFAALCALPATSAMALEVQPGDYGWVGHGRTLALAYFQNLSSDTFKADGATSVPESKFSADILILRAVHYREIAGQKFAFHAIAPIGDFKTVKVGGANPAVADGFGDVTVGVTWFPMTSDKADGTTLGASLFVTAPTGEYDSTNVSFGSGTWSITPQVGMVQGLGKGFFLDASAEATFSKDWDDNGNQFSRDPSAQASVYLRYQYNEATAFSAGYVFKNGGELFQNGLATGEKTESEQLRLVASHFVTPAQQVQVMIGKDISTEQGFKNEPLLQVRLTSVF